MALLRLKLLNVVVDVSVGDEKVLPPVQVRVEKTDAEAEEGGARGKESSPVRLVVIEA